MSKKPAPKKTAKKTKPRAPKPDVNQRAAGMFAEIIERSETGAAKPRRGDGHV